MTDQGNQTVGNLEQLLQRLSTLRDRGKDVLQAGRAKYSGGLKTVDRAQFEGWKTQVQNYLVNLVGPDHIYYINFDTAVANIYDFNVESGVEILGSLYEDLQQGFLTSYETLVSSAVFADFLEMASHLLANGYKDAAASLIGAVLENSLRRIARNNSVRVASRDDLSTLNNKCADKGAYNRIEQQQVQAWSRLRNSADHGHFESYDADAVKRMLSDVRRFVSQYLT